MGKGLDPALERGLRSDALLARQAALQVVVRRWVGRRLALMRLSAEERSEWSRRLEERSGQGKARLAALRGTDPVYKGWSGYAGCPACDGSTAACRTLDVPGKKK